MVCEGDSAGTRGAGIKEEDVVLLVDADADVDVYVGVGDVGGGGGEKDGAFVAAAVREKDRGAYFLPCGETIDVIACCWFMPW